MKELIISDNIHKWGIDVTGRKMRYAPWLTDPTGNYLNPTPETIENVYGISGEAVSETLEAFRRAGGSLDALIQLLNEHIINSHYRATPELLSNPQLWYTNEFYFYFILFTKKLLQDYLWRFKKVENELLSAHHKIYEIGFLRYNPFNENDNDVTGAIAYSLISHYSKKGFDFSDLFTWVDSLTIHKHVLSYRDIFKIKNYWISGELIYFIYEFFKILLNKNDFYTIVNESFDSYSLKAFNYVTEKMVAPIMKFFIFKTTNVFKIDIKHKKGAFEFTLDRKKEFDFKKMDIYQRSIHINVHKILLGGMVNVIKRNYSLVKPPILQTLTPIDQSYIHFFISFQKERNRFATSLFILSNSLYLGLSCILTYFVPFLLIPEIILFLLGNVSIVLAYKYYKAHKKIAALEAQLLLLNEENADRINELENLSKELVIEKKSLEQKVEQRTTELRITNQHLKELDQTKTNFMDNISHELKTPLSLILLSLEEVLNQKYGHALTSDNEVFRLMHRNSLRLLRLINNYLSFSQMTSGRMHIRKQMIAIIPFVEKYLAEFHLYIQKKQLTILFKHELDKEQKVFIDPYLFESILINLVMNAIKFLPDEGLITISLELDEQNHQFLLKVEDNGIGIHPDKISKIFDRFYQAHDKKLYAFEGTGVGLSIVKEYVELHQGTIKVESQLDRGTLFTVSIPMEDMVTVQKISEEKESGINEFLHLSSLSEPQPANQKKNKLTEISFLKKNVFVIEDNADMLDYLVRLLREEFTVISAENGVRFFEKVSTVHPDLIIADIMMPYLNGIELRNKLLRDEKLKVVPFLFLTAKSSVQSQLEGLSLNAIDYITKPFSPESLIAKIKSILNNSDAQFQRAKKDLENKIKTVLDENDNDQVDRMQRKLTHYQLTEREMEIVQYVFNGHSDKEIAEMLFISPRTVSNHIYNILYKLNFKNRIELIRFCLEN